MRTFLDERCIIGEKQTVSGGALYEAYRRWADDNGEFKRRNRDFAKALEDRGFSKSKRKNAAVWVGISIQEDEI